MIEGPNLPFLYSKTMQEVMSVLNLANIGDLSKTHRAGLGARMFFNGSRYRNLPQSRT